MSVSIYLIEQVFEGSRYGGEICARSFGEAELLASQIGATVLGTSEQQSCARCGDILRDTSHVLGDNEWPDTVTDA